MFFCLLYLLSALSISVIAAYFSIIGLATIFPGSMTPIIIMGSVLEIGKIVTAIWLHRNWKTAPLAVKSYLSFATLTLMGITSMGIFGFLSRAHIEHQTGTEKAMAEVQVIENKILREKEYVSRQQEYISGLETRANQTSSTSRIDIDQENQKIKDITEQLNKDMAFELNRTNAEKARLQDLDNALVELESSSGGLFSNKKKKIEELKASQAPIRDSIASNIKSYNANIDNFRSAAQSKIAAIEEKITNFRNQSQEKGTSVQPQIEGHSKNISDAYGRIDELENSKIGLADSARKLEAEIGPVKYVAEAIADFTGKEFDVSQAVRIVILILVLVFDPLAILLVIAANISIEKYMPKSNKKYRNLDNTIKDLEQKKTELDESISELEVKLEDSTEQQESLENDKVKHKQLLADITTAENKQSDAKANLESIKLDTTKHSEELSSIRKSIEQYSNKLNEEKQEYQDEKSSLELAKQKLESNKESLNAEESIIETKKHELDQAAEKNQDRIKQQEEILEHINKEKEKSAQEKNNLEQASITLKQEIDSRQEIIKKLKDTYQKSINSSNLVDIFKNTNASDMSTVEPSGERTLSIIDERDRIHQFIIPKQHCNLPNTYFHDISKALGEVVNPDDLEHEYKLLIKKYITFNFPSYNCLT